jgi:predicted  nucleic acid-binding Zn-ribbon protein
MSEYVRKEELKKFFESIEITVAGRSRAEAISEVLQAIYNGVMELSTTDAEPVRHGKWEPCCEWHGTNGEVETRAYACSECAVIIPTDSYDVRFLRGCFLRYCPNCGARMDEE